MGVVDDKQQRPPGCAIAAIRSPSARCARHRSGPAEPAASSGAPSASRSGPYGTSRSCSLARPSSTTKRCAAARAASSDSRRVFPIPASPRTSSSRRAPRADPRPERARAPRAPHRDRASAKAIRARGYPDVAARPRRHRTRHDHQRDRLARRRRRTVRRRHRHVPRPLAARRALRGRLPDRAVPARGDRPPRARDAVQHVRRPRARSASTACASTRPPIRTSRSSRSA